MCGIIGYTGKREALPVLLAGLAALEYRGYDSAGVALAGVGVVKSVGKVALLADKCAALDATSSYTGIAHTRWATHGVPSEVNAHPHTDASGTIQIVHNGIIENWRELKVGLEAQGIVFESATDTEVLAKLIGHHYSGDIVEAVTVALALVRGAYGLVVTSAGEPDTLVVARLGSPIVIGVGDGERLVASDPTAILPYTKRLLYLADGEMAVLTPDTHRIITAAGSEHSTVPEEVSFDIEVAKKEGYSSFMEKEIFEAPTVIENTIRGRVSPLTNEIKLGGLEEVLGEVLALDRLIIVACGSAYYAGQVGRLMLEEYAGIPVEVELGSEYRYKRHVAKKGTGVLAITQSGETADTLASIKAAKDRGLLTLGIVNVVGSSIARETVAGVYNHAGPEIAVASTKAFLSQLTVLALITTLIGQKNKNMSEAEAVSVIADLVALPDTIRTMLADTSRIKAIAKKYADSKNMMFIGRKFHAPIAYEGSLKLKEVTYIHAEAYAAGELKHGSIALLGPDFPVVALAPQDDMYEKMMSNVEEVLARQSPLILIATEGDHAASELTSDVIFVPKVHPLLQPILSTIPLQLLSYYVGVAKGFDVDRPRNLAKSVTVE
jgi:glutamine---fructose-6-phosphate transaminase (isomerizing)